MTRFVRLAVVVAAVFFGVNAMAIASPSSSYAIVVDCGSSGTRIHEYRVVDGQFSEVEGSGNKVTGGVSSFIDKNGASADTAGVDEAGLTQSIQTLMSTWSLTSQVPSETRLYVYGTGGLRMVRPDAAEKALEVVANTMIANINSHSGPLGSVNHAVISGDDEAFYDWVGVNIDHLQKADATVGALDLGGASVEAAFEDVSNQMSHRVLEYHGHSYNIATYSLLGGGEDQALAAIDGYIPNNRAVCFAKGVWSTAATRQQEPVGYDFDACKQNASTFLQQFNDKESLSKLSAFVGQSDGTKWVAFSGFQYTADFFGAKTVEGLSDAAKQFNGVTWAQLIDRYPDKSLVYLQKYDFVAAYAYALLHWLPVDTNNVSFVDGADWTSGVAFQALN